MSDPSAPASNGPELVTADDLRRLEARLDARLQEASARLVLHDGRFSAMTDRLNQADRRADASSARVDARFGAIDRRFDDLDARLDLTDARITETRDQLVGDMDEYRAALLRSTRVGVLVTVVVNALMLVGAVYIASR